jgi:hypothetical protein
METMIPALWEINEVKPQMLPLPIMSVQIIP